MENSVLTCYGKPQAGDEPGVSRSLELLGHENYMERNLNEHEKLVIKELIEAFSQNTPQKLLYIHSNPIKKKKVIELLKHSNKFILSNNIPQPK